MSSIVHAFLSTTPFLALFIYFLYSAHKRPDVLLEAMMNNEEVEVIPLSDMMHTMLGMLLFYTFLSIYLWFFVKRRRKLMKRYDMRSSNDGGRVGVKTVIGNVLYDRPRHIWKLIDKFYYTDLAYVTYKYPTEMDQNDSCNDHGGGGGEEMKQKFVEKKIRTYHPYHRENVTVLILDGLPLSGQPVADVDRDLTSFQSEYAVRNRDKINHIIVLCSIWIVICLSSALYILRQLRIVGEMQIQEEEEDVDAAWMYFWIYILGVIPVVAVFGNMLQWWLHYRWITKGGTVTDTLTKAVPSALQTDDFRTEEEAKRYVSMA